MAADVWVLRSEREQASSEKVRQRAEEALLRVHKAAEQIRRMTRIYQERLEGRRGQ